MWTEVGQAHGPEAREEMEKTAAWLHITLANNAAGLTDSQRKRPLIRPLHVRPVPAPEEKAGRKRGSCGVFGGAGRDYICRAIL